MELKLRAFVTPEKGFKGSRRRPFPRHRNGRTLTFDCETRTDASQRLRFGAYRIDDEPDENSETLVSEGLFYDEGGLDEGELETLKEYAHSEGLPLLSYQEFSEEILLRQCYELSGTIIGFNLPFDLSRLAVNASPSRRYKNDDRFENGITLHLLSNQKYRGKVRVGHVNANRSHLSFYKEFDSYYFGNFIDVKTLGTSLLSGTSSLASVAKAIGVSHEKMETDEHGKTLTRDYIEYARNDVTCTWECYCELLTRLGNHAFDDLDDMQVNSEATIGKAYLRDFGILPWRHVQPNFPPEITGKIMSSYFGGRTEVRIRRDIREVFYADFLSMYPTVNALMGLWKFVIAEGVDYDESDDAKSWVTNFLENVTGDDFQCQEIWRDLTTLVQVKPKDDVLPIRADFADSGTTNIGINHLTSDAPLWFTLADCVVSKLLTGKTPKVERAIRFSPMSPQHDLKAKKLLGQMDSVIDPYGDDFFKRLIEERAKLKAAKNSAAGEEKARLKIAEKTVKIIANAASYGLFIELNPKDYPEPLSAIRYGFEGEPHAFETKTLETPGEYFHPLLATCITGAARLMLALAEWRAAQHKIHWTFCDTDGLALAKPDGMERSEFLSNCRDVLDWFKPLNPYDRQSGISVLEPEEENFHPAYEVEKSNPDWSQLEPLYCYAVSAKRYVLFNEIDGDIKIRKSSAHGLGYWATPFGTFDENAGEWEWRLALWEHIIKAAKEGKDDEIDLAKDDRFNLAAAGQSTITRWGQFQWYSRHNAQKAKGKDPIEDYRNGIQPFNFFLRFLNKAHDRVDDTNPDVEIWRDVVGREPKLAAPFDKDLNAAASKLFDIEVQKNDTAEAVDFSPWLRSFSDRFSDYNLHRENKFADCQVHTKGLLQRRHVEASGFAHIGKESHNWDETLVPWADEDGGISFGTSNLDIAAKRNVILTALNSKPRISNKIVRMTGVSKTTMSQLRQGKPIPPSSLAKIHDAVLSLMQAEKD